MQIITFYLRFLICFATKSDRDTFPQSEAQAKLEFGSPFLLPPFLGLSS